MRLRDGIDDDAPFLQRAFADSPMLPPKFGKDLHRSFSFGEFPHTPSGLTTLWAAHMFSSTEYPAFDGRSLTSADLV
jgi:hypothetical protein